MTSREFLAREQCVSVIIIYILVFYCANAQKHWNMHLCNWKQHSLTLFSQFLTRCLNWLSFHKTIKYSDSRHCPRKIGYTFHGPCLHGLVKTQLYRFRTVTPVWIHIWWWNDAYSLMVLMRGALLFFKIIRQISRSHGSKNCRIWPRLGVSGL